MTPEIDNLSSQSTALRGVKGVTTTEKTFSFYTYVFLDPRKPGNYQYGEYKFDYEPYYVGKGKDTRYKRHFDKSNLRSCKNLHKRNKINKLISLGFNPSDYVAFPLENSTEENAHNTEKLLIKIIGRRDLKSGPLTNMTDGGEGQAGVICKNKGKTLVEIMGKKTAAKIIKINSERIKRIGAPSESPEARLKISIANGRPVKQLDMNGNLIKIWRSICFAAKELNIGVSTIFNCLTIKEKSITAGGFKWEFEDCPNLKYSKEYENRHKLNSKYYKITKGDKIFYVRNLLKFAKERGMKRDSLASSYRFNRIYKGYKVEKISREEFEKFVNLH